MNEMQAVILAAGKSSRMAINGTKLLYKFHGKSIISRVVEACNISDITKINIIVGYESEKIIRELGNGFNYIFQEEQLGTGDALKKYFDSHLEYNKDLLVLVGDTPLINKSFISNIIKDYYENGSDTLLVSGEITNNIPPYARVIRSSNNKLIEILEDFDCSDKQKEITEVVTSQYCFKSSELRSLFSTLEKRGENGQYYLNDLINKQQLLGKKIDIYRTNAIKTVYGINTFEDLNFIMDQN